MAIQKPVRTVQVGRAVTAVEEMSSKNTDCDKPPTELDIFRDTPIRYLGYANEVGESLRALVHVSVVRFSYVISCSYVCADACSKGMKTAKLPWSCDSEKTRKVTESVVDTLVWQGLASVAVPGFTINRICWLTGQVLQRSTSLPAQTRKWIMLATGLAAIPFIIKPIDHATDWTLDRSLRRLPGMSHEDS